MKERDTILGSSGLARRGSRWSRLLLTHLILLAMGLYVGLQLTETRHLPPEGVLRHTAEVHPGLVLLPRLGTFDRDQDTGQVFLIAKDGSVHHEWTLPNPVAGHVALMPDGTLLSLGLSEVHIQDRQLAPAPGAAGVLERFDGDGRLLWSHEDTYMHHDFDILPDGTIAYLRWHDLPKSEADQVQGGLPGTEAHGTVWDDEIVELSTRGDSEVVWRASDALDPAQDAIPDHFARAEWTHANSLQYVPRDPLTGREAYLVSFRQLSLIMLVDRNTGEIIWRYGGAGLLHEQHDPSVLDNGNILVYDNGQYRLNKVSASAVLEIDPKTNEVVWSYRGPGVVGWKFYSPIISGAQRLPNGNTLITEGLPGRLLEVTNTGRIVWEYTNPHHKPDAFGGSPNRAVFKSRSYSIDFLQPLLEDA